MQIERIKNRGILFTHNLSDWNLNLYLIIGDKYNYIIDSGLGSLCIDAIQKYTKNNKQTIVINTHYHWDHIWGNSSLRDCIIISHKLCVAMIESQWEDMLQKNKQYCYGKVEKYLPNLVFDEKLYFPEDKIKLFHTPGHTIDSISVFDETEKVLLVGDNVGDSMDDIIPSIYCEKDVYFNTIRNYEKIDFDTCISGHNTVLTKEVLGQILSKI